MITSSTGYDDHYAKMFAALENPKAAQEQLRVIADQHKAVKAATETSAEERKRLEAAKIELETLQIDHDKRHEELEAKDSKLQSLSKQLADKKEFLQATQNTLDVGWKDYSDKKDGLDKREKIVSLREQKFQEAELQVEYKSKDAEKLRREYEDKLKTLKSLTA